MRMSTPKINLLMMDPLQYKFSHGFDGTQAIGDGSEFQRYFVIFSYIKKKCGGDC